MYILYFRVEGKSFHFDVGQNSRGIYMKISEVFYTVMETLFGTVELHSTQVPKINK